MDPTTLPARHALLAAALLLLAAACSSDQWRVKGRISADANAPMLVQAADNGRWYTLDTIARQPDGKFSYAHPAAANPDIYRLNIGGRCIYFPVDSVETVVIEAPDSAFDAAYTLSGSPSADAMMAAERMLRDASRPDSLLKLDLARTILANPSGIVAYYLISKQINGQRLFNPAVRADNRIIGAVANAYSERRPSDPRTAYLRQLYLGGRVAINPAEAALATDTIQATELAYFDIALTNQRGDTLVLSQSVEANKVVVLSFTAYTAEGSTAYNALLADAYRRYHSQGMEIYQVAFDDDEFQWKKSANNLPWLTVYHPATLGTQLLLNYNVQGLPTTYVIANGQITDRVADPADLAATVARRL